MRADVRARLIAVACLCLLAACARTVPPPAPPAATVPHDFPNAYYVQAAGRGEPVFRVDPDRSLVVVRVYRGGPLARLGHDHAVASRDVRGYVRLPAATAEARADLYAPLPLLTVDEPALRAAAGLDTQPSQRDIEATRRNMLEKVLEAARYPFVELYLEPAGAHGPAPVVNARVKLHGETRTMPVTVELDRPSAEALYARGRFSLKQSDFGITPFSVLGGALQVQDRVDVEFNVHGVRVSAGTMSTAHE